jgi:hypothetical protein
MTGESMVEYVKIFHKCMVSKDLLDKEGNNQKVVLYLDGYSAHLDVDVSQFCEDHGIILLCLPANATHLLQPVDVGINAPLKKFWCRELQNHKMASGGRINKYNIGSKLEPAFQRVTKSTIVNSFR